jgi:hypothetical protein
MNENDEQLCTCGSCRWCVANIKSEDDYIEEHDCCTRCNGAGCTKCEE